MSYQQPGPGYQPQPPNPPQGYGQPQPAYMDPHMGQQPYGPSYSQSPPPPAPVQTHGRRRRLFPMIFAILATLSFTLALFGLVIIYAGEYGEISAENECSYSSSPPTGCGSDSRANPEIQAEASAENDSATGVMLFSIGLALGVLFSGFLGTVLMLRRMGRLDPQ